MLYAFYGQFWDKGPGSRKKADVVGWLAEKGDGYVEELKLHIIHELLEFCIKHRATEYAVDKIFAQKEIDVLRLPTKHCEYNPIEMIWSQIKGYVASHNMKWTSLINMKQLVLEAFSSISPEYCQKVCDHVKHLEEVTIQVEMAMDPIVEQIIIKVGESSDEDSDVELEETPLIANTKSNEDQIIQKIIVEHDKLYPRRKSQQYTGCACKGYCNSKKCCCVADNEKCDDCICPPDRCSQLPGCVSYSV